MQTLDRNLRRELEQVVRRARLAAEAGARKALEQLAVHNHESWASLVPDQRRLRNRLRAHARQLGDHRDVKRGTQTIDRLTRECAYEHWHRMLFARFLAEADLLIEPVTGVAISLEEVQQLARERGANWLELASHFAEGMLPQIFRKGDPVLNVILPPETRSELEELLKALPRAVFDADDSLGWVYQFWQADRKDEVNHAGTKIGADDLPAVTQLFTEDYMVLFLLHNTLGAWWAGKVLAARPEIATSAQTEDELRSACAIGDVAWTYLRFMRAGEGPWRPAAGSFDNWPKAAKDVKVLDPCMGSGHFLVFALPIIAAMRAAEEGLSRAAAIQAVLRENLFGLEIDPRCTQIAAFNLALAAWRLAGPQGLPPLHLACSGLSIGAREEEWVSLAGQHARLRGGMERLYRLFEQAPTLGSLINPRALDDDLLVAEFRELQPLLDQALSHEVSDETSYELGLAARGLAHAAEILAGQFTLVATNVPYLGRGKQNDVLKNYCEHVHPKAKADLATCFIERCLDFCHSGGSIALVTPQNWMFLASYQPLQIWLTTEAQITMVAALGARAFQTPLYDFSFVLFISTRAKPESTLYHYTSLIVPTSRGTSEKIKSLMEGACYGINIDLGNNQGNKRILTSPPVANAKLLQAFASSNTGLQTGDNDRYSFMFWEMPRLASGWEFYHRTSDETHLFSGRLRILRWEDGTGALAAEDGSVIRGLDCLGKRGVLVHRMGDLPATLYTGEMFDQNGAVITSHEKKHLPALWCFLASDDYRQEVRKLDNKVGVTPATLVKVPFDLGHWQRVAADKYPDGLPKPHSDDPTQWLFSGHPLGAEQPLHVAVARLLGYRWPRQSGSSFPDCPAFGPDGLEVLADAHGIACLPSLRGEQPAAARIRTLLAKAFREKWSLETERTLIANTGSKADSLEEWLRDDFFAQHCVLFHQRPFIWHFWDGKRDGFHALVNYHRLAAPNGEGRQTFDKLIYTYLGDWSDRQRTDQKAGVEGADARLAAAQHLKAELEKILAGEPPYDLFIRWKPLHAQPIGWEPDLNDGVRINIRPFMVARPLGTRTASACILRARPKIRWDKDRGKEPQRDREDFPWFWGWDGRTQDFAGGRSFDGNRWSDLHYSTAFKRAARERRLVKKTVRTG